MLVGGRASWPCSDVRHACLACLHGALSPGVGSVRHVTIRLFFPLMELLAEVVRMERRRVRHSFIKVNNELVPLYATKAGI